MSKRESYIDFIKGVAILWVILLHSIEQPILIKTFAFTHIWQAVPIFVFVSFYLIFKRLNDVGIYGYYSVPRLVTLFKRIILPYLILQIVILFIYYTQSDKVQIIHLLKVGGVGMGSYYPYLYIQLWLIAPLIFFVLDRRYGGWIILLASIGINFLSYTFIESDRVYSCFLGRYLLMSVVAWNYLKQPNSIIWNYFLPLISCIYWISLPLIDLSPFVDNRWSTQQFPSFFYTFFIVSVLKYLFTKLGKTIKDIFTWMGKNSYQIFIIQMFVFHLFSIEDYMFITSDTLRRCVFVLTSIAMSIIPYYVYSIIKNIRVVDEKYLHNSR